MSTIHATCVAIEGHGVLIRGPSGAGKSDLALRLIDGGALLVADDRVALSIEGGRLVARAPRPLAGLMEVRGLGIVEVPSAASAPILLVCDLADRVERLPDAETATLAGVALPLLRLAPFEASASAKLRLAVRTLARRDAVPFAATGT
jgi:serine kinase of HPr protein (carbohydrate metabolism regulator)